MRTIVFAALFWTTALGLIAFDWARSAAHCNAPLRTLLAEPQGAERCVAPSK